MSGVSTQFCGDCNNLREHEPAVVPARSGRTALIATSVTSQYTRKRTKSTKLCSTNAEIATVRVLSRLQLSVTASELTSYGTQGSWKPKTSASTATSSSPSSSKQWRRDVATSLTQLLPGRMPVSLRTLRQIPLWYVPGARCIG